MNNESINRERGLETIIRDFIQSTFSKMMLEITPEEARKLQANYNEDIVINMTGNHPEYRTSMYKIEKRS